MQIFICLLNIKSYGRKLGKIRPVLTALEAGEEVTFPISRLKSVRTQASELGAIYNRLFKTRTDREKRTITVRRIK